MACFIRISFLDDMLVKSEQKHNTSGTAEPTYLFFPQRFALIDLSEISMHVLFTILKWSKVSFLLLERCIPMLATETYLQQIFEWQLLQQRQHRQALAR